MNPYEWIGLAAGTMTTLAFLPQALLTFRTKAVRDISLPTYALFTTGVFTWLVYGLCIRSVSVVAANLVTFALAASILVMKIRYSRRETKVEN